MTAWLLLLLAAAGWAVLSVLIGLLVGKWLSSPQGAGDDFPPRSSSAPVLDSARRRTA
jgi:hypothetical protein